MKYEKYLIDGNECLIPIPESFQDCLTMIRSDRYRVSGCMSSNLRIVLSIVRHPFSSVLPWFRLSQYKGFLSPLFRHMYKVCCSRFCIYLPEQTKVGYGLYIGHGFCIVVNENAVLGNNVNLSQFVNIGSNENNTAKIGDNVYIGPNVSIVEEVTIGSNAAIGAGAVVSKNIPSGSTAVGVPARPINYNNPGRYILNRWNVSIP